MKRNKHYVEYPHVFLPDIDTDVVTHMVIPYGQRYVSHMDTGGGVVVYFVKAWGFSEWVRGSRSWGPIRDETGDHGLSP